MPLRSPARLGSSAPTFDTQLELVPWAFLEVLFLLFLLQFLEISIARCRPRGVPVTLDSPSLAVSVVWGCCFSPWTSFLSRLSCHQRALLIWSSRFWRLPPHLWSLLCHLRASPASISRYLRSELPKSTPRRWCRMPCSWAQHRRCRASHGLAPWRQRMARRAWDLHHLHKDRHGQDSQPWSWPEVWAQRS